MNTLSFINFFFILQQQTIGLSDLTAIREKQILLIQKT